jgi:Trypsin-like peptidase domain
MPFIAKPSVQSLFLQLRYSGQNLAIGTGFVVESTAGPLLITNRHNVTGRNQNTGCLISSTGGVPDEILITHNSANRIGEWTHSVETLYVDQLPRWIEHPTFGDRADIVALPLTQLENVNLEPYSLQESKPDLQVGPASEVSVIGFPFGVSAEGYAIWATGFLASEPHVDVDGLPVQLIDCRTRQGQSGSPVIAYRKDCWVHLDNNTSSMLAGEVWKFIGVYSGRINEESDLGIVWKASAVRDLVGSA